MLCICITSQDKRRTCPVCRGKLGAGMSGHTRKLHGQTSYLRPKCDNYVVISLKEHFKNCHGKLNINRTLESQTAYFTEEKGNSVQNKKNKNYKFNFIET